MQAQILRHILENPMPAPKNPFRLRWGSSENSTLREAAVAVLLRAGSRLVDSLAQELKQGRIRMACGPRVIDHGRGLLKQPESFIHFPQEEKAAVRCDLFLLEINGDGLVEIRTDRFLLRFTNSWSVKLEYLY